MSFRFRRTLSLLPGIRLNLSKSGAAVSVGPKGAKITAGPTGIGAAAGVPGTGMFWSKQITHKGDANADQRAEPQLRLPPEVEQLIRERPPHWEFLLIQRALRSAVDDIDAMVAIASSHGTDAITFDEWVICVKVRHVRGAWQRLYHVAANKVALARAVDGSCRSHLLARFLLAAYVPLSCSSGVTFFGIASRLPIPIVTRSFWSR
jgi:hypothetical protein